MNKTVPCLVYVTLDNEIVIYYDVVLNSIQSFTLINYMKNYMKDYLSLKENQNSLGKINKIKCVFIYFKEWSRPEQASLFHSCLYYDENSDAIQAYKTLLTDKLDKVQYICDLCVYFINR